MLALLRPWHVQHNTQQTQSHIILLRMSNNISLPSLVAVALCNFFGRRTLTSKVVRPWHVRRVPLGHGIAKGSWFGTLSIRPGNMGSVVPPVWPAGVTKHAT